MKKCSRGHVKTKSKSGHAPYCRKCSALREAYKRIPKHLASLERRIKRLREIQIRYEAA